MDSVEHRFFLAKRSETGPKKVALLFRDGSYRVFDFIALPGEDPGLDLSRAVGIAVEMIDSKLWVIQFRVGAFCFEGKEPYVNVEAASVGVHVEIRECGEFERDLKYDLERCLQAHNWNWTPADPFWMQQRCGARWLRIRQLVGKIPEEEAQKVWEKYAPAGYSLPDAMKR